MVNVMNRYRLLRPKFKMTSFLFLLVFLSFPFESKAVTFDDNVLKSVLQLKIYDSYLNKDLGWGTGVNIGTYGVSQVILTNYHVAKLTIENPDRYKIYGCVVTTLNNYPNCKFRLSTSYNFPGLNIAELPKYDQNYDLALLYMDQVYVNEKWQNYTGVATNQWLSNSVYLSDYTKSYIDLKNGDQVYAIGYPDYGGGNTIQVGGVVTDYFTDIKSGLPLVVSDFKISFGNSGGPIFN